MANKGIKINKPNGKFKFNLYWIYILFFVAITAIYLTSDSKSSINKEVSWDKLEKVLLKKDYSKIKIVNKEYAEITIKPQALQRDTMYSDLFHNEGLFSNNNQSVDKINATYTYKFVTYEDFRDQLKTVENQWIAKDTVNMTDELSKQVVIAKDRINVNTENKRSFWGDNMGFIVSTIVIILLWVVFFRMMNRGAGSGGGIGGGIFNVGKSKAKLYDKEKDNHVTFADVAGLEEAKVEVMEIVDFLKSPDKYTKLGGKIPKGALLVGPPGTGKTLLAKAVAGEAKVPFFSLSGSDFVEMFVGVGASRVRDLFATAKEKAPCIIFIDEIDAIGRARGKNLASGGNDERENTLNQLLTEMDGFGTNAGVIILAATNRADILDKALLRAGRFDRQIYVELPEVKERKAIFKVHMKDLKFDKDEVNVDFLAKQTPGFSGADIANICNEAALIAARHNKKMIGKQDFLDAVDRIIGGLEKKSKIISPKEKKIIAYHEAGHASVSWLLEYANPLLKVTIVPRGQALGAAWYVPEERQITTKGQMMDQMISLLGGRASEEVVFGEVSTGALNDLERATKQAFAMVTYYGLDKEIGNLSYYDSSGQSEYSLQKPYSEKTSETIDKQVKTMIEQAYQTAKTILVNNREKLDELAKILVEREVIFREDVEKIYGKRPWDEDKIDEINDNSKEKIEEDKEKQDNQSIDNQDNKEDEN
ncbi:MAG: ATP-dependent zinc metalloprotease FtsH [Bacteroidales bacterium]|jgi:AFG3 family protein|nr:ATP-dependent zinc metalloprotease FtsH [Bacteroidales bacterium]